MATLIRPASLAASPPILPIRRLPYHPLYPPYATDARRIRKSAQYLPRYISGKAHSLLSILLHLPQHLLL